MLKKIDVSFKTIAANSLAIYFGFTIWRVLFNNYAKEVFDINPFQIGVIQAVREVPGLLGFGTGLLALVLAESKISALSVLILGLGLLTVGNTVDLWMLGFGTFVMSVGFHYFLAANKSQLLSSITTFESGRMQGKLMSLESTASVFATLVVLVSSLILDYHLIFSIFGSLLVLLGVYFAIVIKPNRVKEEKRKARLKSRYWLFYILNFLRGSRRHVFTTFAIFLLVANHRMSITGIYLLLLVNSIIIIFTAPLIGYLTETVGERNVLFTSSFLLVFIFLGYAYVQSLPILVGCFILDHILFGSMIALDSYLRKISAPEDLTANLSFSVTANHLSAVVIPLAGGAIWDLFGYQITFLFGSAIVFIDMLFASLVDPSKFAGTTAVKSPLIS